MLHCSGIENELENERTIFQAPYIVKNFCKIPCIVRAVNLSS
jgi:hypothetical protein